MLSFQFKVKALKSAQLTSKADMTMCIWNDDNRRKKTYL